MNHIESHRVTVSHSESQRVTVNHSESQRVTVSHSEKSEAEEDEGEEVPPIKSLPSKESLRDSSCGVLKLRAHRLCIFFVIFKHCIKL